MVNSVRLGPIDISKDVYLDRRVIDKINIKENQDKHIKFKSNYSVDINILYNRLIILGRNVIRLSNDLIAISDGDDLIIVSNNIIRLPSNSTRLFHRVKFDSIDLTGTDSSNIEIAREMFSECRVNSLNLQNFNTSRIKDMERMFFMCTPYKLDLSSFDTSQVVTMDSMFYGCLANEVNLASFNTFKVSSMYCMFRYSHINQIDISSFYLEKANLHGMFSGAYAELIILPTINSINAICTVHMFDDCDAKIKLTKHTAEFDKILKLHDVYYRVIN